MTLLALIGLALLVADTRSEPGSEVTQAIVQLLSQDLNVRDHAIQRLEKMGPRAAPAVRTLIVVLQFDKIADIRFSAARALGKLGAAARPALPALRDALKDPDHLVHVFAAQALIQIDPGTTDIAIPALAEALRFSRKEPAEVPPSFVYGVLWRLGPKARGAEAAVVEGLVEPDLMSRFLALQTLEAMGSDNPALVPRLGAVLVDGSWGDLWNGIRDGGKAALFPLVVGQIPTRGTELTFFLDNLADVREFNRLSRISAANLLGKMGSKAQAAVPALRRALEDPRPGVRQAVQQALLKIQVKD